MLNAVYRDKWFCQKRCCSLACVYPYMPIPYAFTSSWSYCTVVKLVSSTKRVSKSYKFSSNAEIMWLGTVLEPQYIPYCQWMREVSRRIAFISELLSLGSFLACCGPTTTPIKLLLMTSFKLAFGAALRSDARYILRPLKYIIFSNTTD